jgi:hypothetical protein
MSKIGYCLFCLRWLYRNRNWASTRQKYKALDKAWKERGK